MKSNKLTGWVDYIPRLGWIFLIVTESHWVQKDGYSTRITGNLPRRYWLVDWSNDVDEICGGLWEAETGDFTDRYHDDWVRPIQMIHNRKPVQEAT